MPQLLSNAKTPTNVMDAAHVKTAKTAPQSTPPNGEAHQQNDGINGETKYQPNPRQGSEVYVL